MTAARQFTKISNESNITFVSASKLSEAGTTGVVAEGIYVGPKTNPNFPEKTDFELETEDGATLIVNGAGNLGSQMKSVSPGDLIQISYLGKNEMKKGKYKGKLAHNFEIAKA